MNAEVAIEFDKEVQGSLFMFFMEGAGLDQVDGCKERYRHLTDVNGST